MAFVWLVTGCTAAGTPTSPQGAGRMGTNYTSPPGYNNQSGTSRAGLGAMGTRPGAGGRGISTVPRSGAGTSRTGTTGMTKMRSTSTHLGATGSTGKLRTKTRLGSLGTPTPRRGTGMGGVTGSSNSGRGVGLLGGAATKTSRNARLGALGSQAAKSVKRSGKDVSNIPGKATTGAGRLMTRTGQTLKKAGRATGVKPPKKSATGSAGILGAFTGKRGMKTGAPKATTGKTAKKGPSATGKAGALHVLGFVTNQNPTGGTTAQGLQALGSTPKAVSYLSPLWFSVKPDGSLVDKSSTAIMTFANRHKIPIVPLVNNQNTNDIFLQSDRPLMLAVNNINTAIKKHGFAGVSIDFQGLQPKDRTRLNTFMDELSAKLKPEGKLLTVDIIPTASQTGAHGAYDEHTLARYADQIILMTYDKHDNTSPPGPVAPQAWVENAVKHTLQAGVPASKIYLGVNDYGYDWNTSTGSGTTVGAKQAAKLGPVKFSQAANEAHITYTKNGTKHVVWFGNAKSLKKKVALAKKYHLYGLAVWQVGEETSTFWKTLASQNGTAPRKLGAGTSFNSALKGEIGKKGAVKTKKSAAGKTSKKAASKKATKKVSKKASKRAGGRKGAKKSVARKKRSGKKKVGIVATAASRRSTGGGGMKADRMG